MNLKYTLGALISIPLLPIMYLQGKKIRANITPLPEATGTTGKVSVDSDKTINILSIGESTIAGVGVATHEEGFTGTFAREIADRFKTNVNWKVYAKSGYTAKRVRYKTINKIKENEADLILIGLGGNDAFTLNRPSKWRADMESLIDLLQERFGETPIVLTNMPPIKLFPAFTGLIKFTVGNLVEILGDELNALVQTKKNVYYSSERISFNVWLEKWNVKGQPSDFFSDGVHPSKITYQVWAKDMALFVEEQKIQL